MSEKPDVQPWPVWGRVLFLGGLVAVLAVAAYIAFSSGRVNWAAARIALVVVAVPAIGMLLVSLVSGARERRSLTDLRNELATTAGLIGEEERRSPGERSSGASDHELVQAATTVAEIRRQLDAGQGDRVLDLVRRLQEGTRGWQAPSRLADSVGACAQHARRWDRARRTGAGATARR